MEIDKLLERALNFDFLTAEEGVFLFENAFFGGQKVEIQSPFEQFIYFHYCIFLN